MVASEKYILPAGTPTEKSTCLAFRISLMCNGLYKLFKRHCARVSLTFSSDNEVCGRRTRTSLKESYTTGEGSILLGFSLRIIRKHLGKQVGETFKTFSFCPLFF